MTDDRDQQLEVLRKWLLGLIRSKCARWLVQESEDLVQEVLMKVVELEPGRGPDNPLPRSYIRKIAYSRLIDEIRRRRVRRADSLGDAPSAPRVHDPQPDPGRSAESADLARAILACLGEMVVPRRIAVSLHLRGHPHREIAEHMGWNLRRAHNLVFRGMENLRRCLERKGMSS